MPPKPDPKEEVKISPAEQKAIDAANAVTDTVTDEVKKEMRKESRTLQKQIEDEEKITAFYQQEREKLNYDWIISKKELDDKRSELINKERELEDLKENHIMTINLYKQRVKHLLFQNQDQQSQLRKDVEITIKQREDEHRIKERELKTDNRALKSQMKEQELSNLDFTFALTTEFDKKNTLLRQDYERMFNDVKKKYDMKMLKIRTEMEDYRDQLIKQAEEKKNTKIALLTKEHTRKFNEIKNYYADITGTNLALIKQLKTEINDLQSKEDSDKKMLQQIERESRELQDPMKSLMDEIKLLDSQLIEHDKVQAEKEVQKKQIEELEVLFRKMEFEYEVKMQQYTYLAREKDQLFKKFNEQIYEIQQKIGLQNLILEKKLISISENIELKDLELEQVLKAANINPSSLGNINKSLQEVESAKSDLIRELESQLVQIRKAHSHMVKAYEGKLSEFVIPVEELGFDPLVPTNVD